VVATKAAAMP